jgi:hypothetical protein
MPDMLPKIRHRRRLRNLVEVFGGQTCHAAAALANPWPGRPIAMFSVTPKVPCLERR